MKKLISLALCVVMICMALVSCEDVIGEDLHKEGGLYEQGLQSNVAEPLAEIDFYVVVSDDVDLSDGDVKAQYNTVQTQLNAELKDAYNIKLYIHYVNEKDYDAEIEKAVKPGYNRDGKGRSETADVILINSKSLHDKLVADDMLLALDSQLSKNTYGMLNAQIAESLWDATRVEIDGTSYQFVVPNNRIVGKYTYLLLDRKEIQEHSYSERYISHGNYTCSECNCLYDVTQPFSLDYVVAVRDGSKVSYGEPLTMHFAAGTKLDDVYSLILEKEGLTFGAFDKFISEINCKTDGCKANFIINNYKCSNPDCGAYFDGTVKNTVNYEANITKTTVQEFITVEEIDGEDVEIKNVVEIKETVDVYGQSNKITTVTQTYMVEELEGEGDDAQTVFVEKFYKKGVLTEVIAKNEDGEVKLTSTEILTNADGEETESEPTVTDAELVDVSEWNWSKKGGNKYGVNGTYKNDVISNKNGSFYDFSLIKNNAQSDLEGLLAGLNSTTEIEGGEQTVTYSGEITKVDCWDVATPFEDAFTASHDYRMIDLMNENSEDLLKIFKDMYEHELGEAWVDKLEESIVEGYYADKVYYENGEHTDVVGDKFYCKILAYPQVTSEEAFESAYAIVRDNVNSLRCMDLIKAINLDAKIRNLLQFGKETVNYKVSVDPVTKDKTIIPVDGNEYVMNPLHTGNIFIMYYVDGVWDAEMKSWADKQNDESFYKAD